MNSGGVSRPNGSAPDTKVVPRVSPPLTRLDDGIYQNGQLVARALGQEMDLERGEIRFAELYESDSLLLADECDYQKYDILIQKVAFATRLDKTAAHKGRVLKGVVAEILRYRQQ